MCVRIMTICIMNGNVCAHPVQNKCLPDICTRQLYLLLMIEFNRQCNNDFPCQSAILRFFFCFNSVPQLLSVIPF